MAEKCDFIFFDVIEAVHEIVFSKKENAVIFAVKNNEIFICW